MSDMGVRRGACETQPCAEIAPRVCRKGVDRVSSQTQACAGVVCRKGVDRVSSQTQACAGVVCGPRGQTHHPHKRPRSRCSQNGRRRDVTPPPSLPLSLPPSLFPSLPPSFPPSFLHPLPPPASSVPKRASLPPLPLPTRAQLLGRTTPPAHTAAYLGVEDGVAVELGCARLGVHQRLHRHRQRGLPPSCPGGGATNGDGGREQGSRRGRRGRRAGRDAVRTQGWP